jgi:hypothetical protein
MIKQKKIASFLWEEEKLAAEAELRKRLEFFSNGKSFAVIEGYLYTNLNVTVLRNGG